VESQSGILPVAEGPMLSLLLDGKTEQDFE
jgi:hypothetical protein